MKKVLVVTLAWFCAHPMAAQPVSVKLDEWSADQRILKSSIAVNPRNTTNLVAAAAPDNVYYTIDNGATWQRGKVTFAAGVLGDPKVLADGKGDFYYFHQAGEKRSEQLVCHVSKDGGKTWDEGSVINNAPGKDQGNLQAVLDDKQNLYVTWTLYDQWKSSDQECHSVVLYSKSSNGKKWSKPIQISQTPGGCLDDNNAVIGSMPGIAGDGKVFVTWTNQSKIYMDRSFDGDMWLSTDLAILNQAGGTWQEIPGLSQHPETAWLMIDRSKSRFHSTINLVWADRHHGSDDPDIWAVRSMNFGDNWTSPMKINDDEAGNQQYLPSMTIDQSTGNIYVMYFDRREYDDLQSDVYLAYSIDGGSSFKNVKINEAPVVAAGYGGIDAHKGTVALIWMGRGDEKVTVWTRSLTYESLAPPTKK